MIIAFPWTAQAFLELALRAILFSFFKHWFFKGFVSSWVLVRAFLETLSAYFSVAYMAASGLDICDLLIVGTLAFST